MRTWFRAGAIAAGALVACKFAPAGFEGSGGDAKLPDAGVCTGFSAACADPDTLRTCTGSGTTATDTKCPWGCIGPTSHCGELVPSGGAVMPSDLNPDGALQDVSLGGTVNGDDGSIVGTHPRTAGGDGMITNGVGYYRRGNISVFRFKSIDIGKLKILGTHPVALVATDSITVDDAIDVTGGCIAPAAGPGGFAGGASGSNAPGSGGGSGGGADGTLGGGGGGNGGSGGTGGALSAASSAGGASFGDAQITVLVGGGGGGGGGHGAAPKGGGGGGALQLVAGTTITINTNGQINAGGCGGVNGAANDSGAGGGAGGTLLLEAFDIISTGQLAVNGGGGGGGGGGSPGDNANVGRALTLGGASSNGSGGSGAGSATLAGLPGLAGNAHTGGGGGGIGRIRINTRLGTASLDETGLSPAPSDPMSTCTVGSASVQ